MKKTILLMLGLVAGTASFAQNSNTQSFSAIEPQVHVVTTNNQKVRLMIQPEASKGKIALLDDMGHSLFTETVALNEGIIQQFDIAQLATGKYSLKVTTPTGTVTKTFIIQPVPHETFVVLES
ncbi:DUF3244 domain-containing protein [Persicitalea jodogahamensis]|nr:T9SS type A sorting domain-containing protein [Persicitalea jodogahamensis]